MHEVLNQVNRWWKYWNNNAWGATVWCVDWHGGRTSQQRYKNLGLSVLLEEPKVAIILLWLKGVTWHIEVVMPLRRPSEVTSKRLLAVRRSRGDVLEGEQKQNQLAAIFHLHSTYLYCGAGGFILQYVPSRVEQTEVEKELFCLLPSLGAAWSPL